MTYFSSVLKVIQFWYQADPLREDAKKDSRQKYAENRFQTVILTSGKSTSCVFNHRNCVSGSLMVSFLTYCSLIGLLLESPLAHQCSETFSFNNCFEVWIVPICLFPFYLLGLLVEAGLHNRRKLCGSKRSFQCSLLFHSICGTLDILVWFLLIGMEE